jgi:hypothetical protein
MRPPCFPGNRTHDINCNGASGTVLLSHGTIIRVHIKKKCCFRKSSLLYCLYRSLGTAVLYVHYVTLHVMGVEYIIPS